MPDSFCGSWELISNVNFEGYMNALGKLSNFVSYVASVQEDLKHLCVI